MILNSFDLYLGITYTLNFYLFNGVSQISYNALGGFVDMSLDRACTRIWRTMHDLSLGSNQSASELNGFQNAAFISRETNVQVVGDERRNIIDCWFVTTTEEKADTIRKWPEPGPQGSTLVCYLVLYTALRRD